MIERVSGEIGDQVYAERCVDVADLVLAYASRSVNLRLGQKFPCLQLPVVIAIEAWLWSDK